MTLKYPDKQAQGRCLLWFLQSQVIIYPRTLGFLLGSQRICINISHFVCEVPLGWAPGLHTKGVLVCPEDFELVFLKQSSDGTFCKGGVRRFCLSKELGEVPSLPGQVLESAERVTVWTLGS